MLKLLLFVSVIRYAACILISGIRGGTVLKNAFCFVCLLCCLAASARPVSAASVATYDGAASALISAVEKYQKMESRLATQQRDQFKASYEAICSAYRTAGILLESATDAADEASAHTSLISYGRIMGELPSMITKLGRLVETFR
jgi:hypothetical protein